MNATTRSPVAPLRPSTPSVRQMPLSARGSRRFLFAPAEQVQHVQPVVQQGTFWRVLIRVRAIAMSILRPLVSMTACWLIENFVSSEDVNYQVRIKCEKIKRIIPSCPAIQQTAHGVAKSFVNYFYTLLIETPRTDEELRKALVKPFFYSGGTLNFEGGVVKRFLSKEENREYVIKLIELNLLNVIHNVLGAVKDLDEDPYFLKKLALKICGAVTARLTIAEQQKQLPTFPAVYTTQQFLENIKNLCFPAGKEELDFSSLGMILSWCFRAQQKTWDKIGKFFENKGAEYVNLLSDDSTKTVLIYKLVTLIHSLLGGTQPVRQPSVVVRRPSALALYSSQRPAPNTVYKDEEALQKALVECIDCLGATLSSTHYVACRASFYTDKLLVKHVKKISEKLAKFNLTNLVTYAFQHLATQVRKPNEQQSYTRVEYLLGKKIIHTRAEEEAQKNEKTAQKQVMENNLKAKLNDIEGQWGNIKNLLVQDKEDANILTRGFNFFKRQVAGSVATNPIHATFDETYRMLSADNFKPLLVFFAGVTLQTVVEALNPPQQ